MKKPVWQSDSKGKPNEAFVSFSAGRDVLAVPQADRALIPFDIWTNMAHAAVLHKAAVYSREELKTVIQALQTLEETFADGKWKLDPKLEDVHINIEAYLNDACGAAIGGKLHTGRSRNDQVATDMKLYAREVLLQFAEELYALLAAITAHAKKHKNAVMPGYTHHRKATVTTWGHWCASYAQGLLRDAQRFTALYDRINTCPLGAAASYGTTWKLNRELAAQLLAFKGVQENTLDAVVSRGEAEAEIAHSSALLLKRLSVISQDLILFSTDEFGYLALPPSFTTGSSIMPQKHNPDFAEAIKGKFHVVQGLASSLLTLNSGNLSGYNKDAQWSKYLFLDAVRESFGCASLLAGVFSGIHVNAKRMKEAAAGGFLNAVDIADHLAATRSLPFRSTYKIISEAVGLSQNNQFDLQQLNSLLEREGTSPLSPAEFISLNDPAACAANRTHTGSPHPKQVEAHIKRLQADNRKIKSWIEAQRRAIRKARQRCDAYAV